MKTKDSFTGSLTHDQRGADREVVRKRRRGKEEEEEEEGQQLLPCIGTLPLRLPSDDVHDGVLRVNTNRRVVLGVDDGGLTARALHLDWLMG